MRRDDVRASEVIRRLRGLLRKSELDVQVVDLNETLRDVLRFPFVQALIRNVKLETELLASAPVYRATGSSWSRSFSILS